MGRFGPKPMSAAVLRARGSKLAAVREREERQQDGFEPVQPKRYPLPRTLSKAARNWGVQLMQEAYYDVTEAKLLSEFLALWDRVQALKTDVRAHGESYVDKNGNAHQRPEARALEHALSLLLQYARTLEVKER